MPYNTLIFDLDNTLYCASSRLFDQIEQRMTLFVSQTLDLEPEAAYRLQKQYFRDYGTTLNGLVKHHQTDPIEFMDFVHDIDLSDIPVNHGLVTWLQQWPGRKLIYTNGSTSHATRVLTHLQLVELMDGIFDIVASNYLAKPSRRAFQQFIKTHDVNPQTAIFFDDIPRNLAPAAEVGMKTVWIESELYKSLQDEGTQGYIHHTAKTVLDGLHHTCGPITPAVAS